MSKKSTIYCITVCTVLYNKCRVNNKYQANILLIWQTFKAIDIFDMQNMILTYVSGYPE